MRLTFSMIYVAMIVLLSVFVVIAHRTNKRNTVSNSVAWLDAALIPPILGNLIVLISSSPVLSAIGFYTYFLGMDVVMLAMLNFTVKYCKTQSSHHCVPIAVYIALGADTLQMLLNPIFHHAFTLEEIVVEGRSYYRFIAYWGQTIHRVVDYSILLGIMAIFLLMSIKMPRVYREKYAIILVSMVVVGIWQSFYIFSRTPIDRSMIGLGVFGILIFYFAIFYRPLRLLDNLLAKMASDMPQALFFFDPNKKCIWANDPGKTLLDIREGFFDLAPQKLREIFGELEFDKENWVKHKVIGSGENVKHYILDMRSVSSDKNTRSGSFLSIRDNTSEQLLLEREKYNATHDTLTGLYNREMLFRSIHKKLKEDRDTVYYIVFVDVKNFKIVNDIFSNSFGDFTLKHIANWIRADMSPRCVYGRMGGDKFGVLMPKEEFEPDSIERSLSNYVVTDGNIEHSLFIHLGVYEVTKTDTDVSVMFDRAHLALSTIKDDYKTHIAYYDDELREKAKWNQHISTQLQHAISQKQVVPYLQPIVDDSGKVVGAEALARWNHPDRGFLSPASFIPYFEKNGLIVEVDKHMWRSACEILSRWEQIDKEMFISVNISPKDFYFMDVKEEIHNLVEEYGIEPKRLRIEITETVMMNDIDERIKILNELRSEGFIVEMDDFGSGYSSLNLLKDMPVDVLKIDMKFLGRSQDSGKAQTILRNIISLSDDLGISSLTEGVETKDQYHMLADMKCKMFQGYYFAKPMPVDQFETFIHKQAQ